MTDDELERQLRESLALPDDAARAAGLARNVAHATPRRSPGLWAVGALAALVPVAAAVAIATVLINPGHRAVGASASTPSPRPLSPPAASPRAVPTPTVRRLVPGERLTGPLASVKFVSGSVGWGLYPAGETLYVLRSIDGGRTWRDVGPRPQAAVALGSAFFLDANHAWVTGSPQDALPGTRSTIYRTSDGGATWSAARATSSFNPGTRGQVTFVDPLHGWIADLGQGASQNTFASVDIYRTDDGGLTWQLVTHTDESGASPATGGIPFECGKQGVGFVSAGVGWLTGGCAGGITFYETRDGGSTWARRVLRLPNGSAIGQAQCEAGPCSLSPPLFTSGLAGRMYFYGYDPSIASTGSTGGGVVFSTQDGGSTWQARPAPTSWPGPPFFVDSTHGWIIESPSTGSMNIIATTDNGGHWQLVGSPVGGYDRGSLDFVGPSRGWLAAVSEDGTLSALLATADGGRTWSDLKPVYAGP